MPKSDDDYFVCPICGEEVPLRALACPECGADDETGWSEEAAYDHVDLPLPHSQNTMPHRGRTSAWFTKAVLILMILLILVFVLAQAL